MLLVSTAVVAATLASTTTTTTSTDSVAASFPIFKLVWLPFSIWPEDNNARLIIRKCDDEYTNADENHADRSKFLSCQN